MKTKKKLIAAAIISLFILNTATAQSPATNTAPVTTSTPVATTPVNKPVTTTSSAPATTAKVAAHPDTIQNWISFSPVILFLIVLLATIFKLKRDNVKLSDLFAEKAPSATPASPVAAPVALAVPAAGAPAPPATTQSVSRFIAFITGLTSLIIGVCITTFYMYCYFINPDKPVDLGNLTTVIWGLGIGVLPYGFNKASVAMK